MTEFIQTDEQLQEIESVGQLRTYFEGAGKPRDAWRVGTEYEKLGVDARTGRAAPYSGPAGIETVLRELAERYGWEPKREGDRIVALYRDNASVTLEPGGQLELSGEQCATIHCAQEEFSTHSREIDAVGRELGIAFLGLGIQPISPIDQIEMVPKRRYGIMGPYMARVGKRGLQMMKQTATVQANFDFADEADAMRKMRTAMGLTPIVTAMFANSSVFEGQLTGYMSLRGHTWTDTDPSRTGLLPFVFSESAGFDEYIRWALDAPMYFVMRDNQYVDLSGVPFRHFLDQGHVDHAHGTIRATAGDWALHLTTLFPEVRLKTYLEIRSADSQPPHLVLAVPALLKGVLYEDDCLEAAWDLVKSWNWEQRMTLYHDAHREGLQARAGRIPLRDLARELAAIARHGLRTQGACNPRGEDETIYLAALDHQLESGASSARYVADNWERGWKRDISRLIAFSSYRASDSYPDTTVA
jgi:glutamate--cysteine ligase